ncbi:ABC transporter permease [Natronomonas marina]|jgi:ABC-type transport system involved in multi-copper enzyme maturation permease subunit|uniref:ABC transporter permease n=1 Tax=Natronomonas marina TaxID=2961939 RepID=UPI0020C98FDD|nr:ABC transporter permease subunit [Natronomonas marina]
MTWRVVARQDLSLTVGARSVKLLAGLLVSVVLLAGYIYPLLTSGPITTAHFPGFVHGWLTTLVPFVGMLVTYNAIASQRESGSIRLSLSLPQSRRDVVLGKFLSRTAVVVGALVTATVGAGALVVYPLGELALLPFVEFLALTVTFGVVWTGLGTAVSLVSATRRRALVFGFGLVFLFVVVWDAIADALALGLAAAGLADGGLPGPIRFLVGLEPGRVFGRVVDGFVTPGAGVEGPWYLNEWVALVLFACWAVGPLGLAFLRFAGSDLS